jgi:uncharacterized protein (DUF433 family)
MRENIEINPLIQHGKPVIVGTRVPVARVISGLAGGMSMEAVMAEYGLTKENIEAALSFAAELIEEEEFHKLSA